MSNRFAIIAFGCCIVGNCIVAHSDPADPDGIQEQAQAHFKRGEALFEAGSYGDAAAAFTFAYETLPHFTVMANIGLAYERAGAYPSAVFYFRRYLRALAVIGESNPKIEALLSDILTKVAELDISAKCVSGSCRILLDNRDIGPSPVQVVVLPGKHDIAVISDGKIRVGEALDVSPGETRTYTLSEVDAPVPVPPPAPPRTDTGMGRPFWVTATFGGVAAVSSAVLWGFTFSTKKAFDAETSIEEKRHLGEKGDRLQAGAVVATGIAGSALVAAVILAAVKGATTARGDIDDARVTPSREGVGVAFKF